MGATFDDETRLWLNKTGSVTVKKRATDIDTMAVMYVLDDYAAFIDARAAEQRKKAGPGL